MSKTLGLRVENAMEHYERSKKFSGCVWLKTTSKKASKKTSKKSSASSSKTSSKKSSKSSTSSKKSSKTSSKKSSDDSVAKDNVEVDFSDL